MYKIRRGNAVITLSDEEMVEVFYAQQKRFRLADAERHLREHFGMENVSYENVLKELDNFHKKYGFPFDSLISENSPNYLLEKLVNMYEKAESCDSDENSVWKSVISYVCDEFTRDYIVLYPLGLAEPSDSAMFQRTPVGRIYYFQPKEIHQYYDAEVFVEAIKEDNYDGTPMAIYVFTDAEGNHMNTDWAAELDPLPQGFEVIRYEQSEEFDQKLWKSCFGDK